MRQKSAIKNEVLKVKKVVTKTTSLASLEDEISQKEVAPQTIGRLRSDYAKMQASGLGKAIEVRKAQDAKMLGISVKTLDVFIEKLNKQGGGAGKRDADAAWRQLMLADTASFLGHVNTLLLTGKLNIPAFKKACVQLSNTSYYGKGGVVLFSDPRLDLAQLQNGKRVEINKDKLFQPFEAGWDDGSKNPRFQYAPREIPVSKSSGYRAEHGFPLAEVKTAPAKKTTPKQSKASAPAPEQTSEVTPDATTSEVKTDKSEQSE